MSARRIAGRLVLAGGLFFLVGCAAPAPRTAVEPIIQPQRADISAARVGIFAFRSPFDDRMVESHLAHQLHQFLLARRMARVVEVIPESFRDLDQAIDRARVLGFDVAVLGQVQEAFYGGSVSTSRATVELRVVDVIRRVTVWYLRARAEADNLPAMDFLVWRTYGVNAKVPMDLVRQLLEEMSERLTLSPDQAAPTALQAQSAGRPAQPPAGALNGASR